MRFRCVALFILLLCGPCLFAKGFDPLPSKFFLTQHWISYTTSFDIRTTSETLGSLYRRKLSLMLTYDFYNDKNQRVTHATARFFSLGAYFDILGENGELLGSVKETVFTLLPHFTLYSTSGEALAYARMNFWGTTFTLYDLPSNKIIAVMSRSLFRLKNDWTIDIKNQERVHNKNINSSLFLTVLALQGDLEEWSKDNNKQALRVGASSNEPALDEFKQRILAETNEHALQGDKVPDEATLERLANMLEKNFQAQHAQDAMNDIDNDDAGPFIEYCLDVAQSNQVSPEEKQAILYLLRQRLGQ